jgi:putative cardiolipin synthase
VRLVPDGFDAFALRVQSARLAEQTLDVQTYIWRDDSTGRFIAHEMLLAADRGVKVRVLLDDMDARPRDLALEALDAHPNISVRMFNPFRTRSGLLRTLAELSQRGKRLNHRMHNKCWVADGALAICGGRNLGNEYFASADGINFNDLDMMMIGPAVEQCMVEFERYWTCSLSVPISKLRKYLSDKLAPPKLRSRLQRSAEQIQPEHDLLQLAGASPEQLLAQTLTWSSSVRVIADDPSKAMGVATADASRVLASMAAQIRAASREVLLISPYFVPGMGGTAALRALALQGAQVQVLTNSLAATDVAIVHSGYTKYRIPLLEAGVRLFELKSAAVLDDAHRRLRLGSSRASLHTKAAVMDGERVFVGSFNIDPRSAELNCEMGVWICSATLAATLRGSFSEGTDPSRSYELSLRTANRIQWHEHSDGRRITHEREPHASWMRRFTVSVLEALPIESLL